MRKKFDKVNLISSFLNNKPYGLGFVTDINLTDRENDKVWKFVYWLKELSEKRGKLNVKK